MKNGKYISFSGETVVSPSRELLIRDAEAYGKIAVYCVRESLNAIRYFGREMPDLDAAEAWNGQVYLYAKSAAHSARLAMEVR